MLSRDILHNQLISRRSFILAGGKLTILSALLGRLFYMQIIKGNEYQVLSDKNRISLVFIPPDRGLIQDKRNVIIAENRPSFGLIFDRKQSKEWKRILDELFVFLGINHENQVFIRDKLKKSLFKTPVTILEDVPWQMVAEIEERIVEFPGMYVESRTLRKYNFAESTAHLLGYVGKLSPQEATISSQNPEMKVGKIGIEKQYEETLQGRFGYRKIEIDAQGTFMGQIEKVDPEAGGTLNLNIDIGLQNYIYEFLPKEGGSAVVMNVKNGEVLALCSSPSFNPNLFAGGISSDYWNSLINDPFKPLINKTCSTQYPPGSTFKLITILAAMEEGISPDFSVFCTGYTMLGDKRFNCWYKPGHGRLDMRGGIKHSCNCYMYNIGQMIGADKILSVAKRFGYGQISGIDLPTEAKGFVPDRAWKIRKFKYDWSAGDSFNIAIGQGALLSTPLHQVRAIAAFANGGYLVRPTIKAGISPEMTKIEVKKEHLDMINEALFSVVNEPGGTCYFARPKNINLAGKTGTSQVQSKKHANDDLSKTSVRWERRNHALFAGFAPFENPKYAISIIIDHGGSGAKVAAPIAQKICDYLY